MAFVSSSFAGAALATRPSVATVCAKPVRAAPTRPTTRMSLAPIAQNAVGAVQNAGILLARDGDFGGYTGPIIGLLTIAVIIAVLTPPVKE